MRARRRLAARLGDDSARLSVARRRLCAGWFESGRDAKDLTYTKRKRRWAATVSKTLTPSTTQESPQLSGFRRSLPGTDRQTADDEQSRVDAAQTTPLPHTANSATRPGVVCPALRLAACWLRPLSAASVELPTIRLGLKGCRRRVQHPSDLTRAPLAAGSGDVQSR